LKLAIGHHEVSSRSPRSRYGNRTYP